MAPIVNPYLRKVVTKKVAPPAPSRVVVAKKSNALPPQSANTTRPPSKPASTSTLKPSSAVKPTTTTTIHPVARKPVSTTSITPSKKHHGKAPLSAVTPSPAAKFKASSFGSTSKSGKTKGLRQQLSKEINALKRAKQDKIRLLEAKRRQEERKRLKLQAEREREERLRLELQRRQAEKQRKEEERLAREKLKQEERQRKEEERQRKALEKEVERQRKEEERKVKALEKEAERQRKEAERQQREAEKQERERRQEQERQEMASRLLNQMKLQQQQQLLLQQHMAAFYKQQQQQQAGSMTLPHAQQWMPPRPTTTGVPPTTLSWTASSQGPIPSQHWAPVTQMSQRTPVAQPPTLQTSSNAPVLNPALATITDSKGPSLDKMTSQTSSPMTATHDAKPFGNATATTLPLQEADTEQQTTNEPESMTVPMPPAAPQDNTKAPLLREPSNLEEASSTGATHSSTNVPSPAPAVEMKTTEIPSPTVAPQPVAELTTNPPVLQDGNPTSPSTVPTETEKLPRDCQSLASDESNSESTNMVTMVSSTSLPSRSRDQASVETSMNNGETAETVKPGLDANQPATMYATDGQNGSKAIPAWTQNNLNASMGPVLSNTPFANTAPPGFPHGGSNPTSQSLGMSTPVVWNGAMHSPVFSQYSQTMVPRLPNISSAMPTYPQQAGWSMPRPALPYGMPSLQAHAYKPIVPPALTMAYARLQSQMAATAAAYKKLTAPKVSRPRRPRAPKMLETPKVLCSPQEAPAPFAKTHQLVVKVILLRRPDDASFGVNLKSHQQSTLVDPEYLDNQKAAKQQTPNVSIITSSNASLGGSPTPAASVSKSLDGSNAPAPADDTKLAVPGDNDKAEMGKEHPSHSTGEDVTSPSASSAPVADCQTTVSTDEGVKMEDEPYQIQSSVAPAVVASSRGMGNEVETVHSEMQVSNNDPKGADVNSMVMEPPEIDTTPTTPAVANDDVTSLIDSAQSTVVAPDKMTMDTEPTALPSLSPKDHIARPATTPENEGGENARPDTTMGSREEGISQHEAVEQKTEDEHDSMMKKEEIGTEITIQSNSGLVTNVSRLVTSTMEGTKDDSPQTNNIDFSMDTQKVESAPMLDKTEESNPSSTSGIVAQEKHASPGSIVPVGPPKPSRRRRRRVNFMVMIVVDADKQNERHSDPNAPLLKADDIILSIGGTNIAGLTFGEACDVFGKNSQTCPETGEIRLEIEIARRKPKEVKQPPPKKEKPTPLNIAPVMVKSSPEPNSITSDSPKDAVVKLTSTPKPMLKKLVLPELAPPNNSTIFSTTELAMLSESIMKSIHSSNRLLGQSISEVLLTQTTPVFRKVAILKEYSDLTHRTVPILQQKWNKMTKSLDSDLNQVAKEYWTKTLASECGLAEEKLSSLPFSTDAKRSALRRLPRPTTGCRCGAQDHSYLHDEKCTLYRDLRRLVPTETLEELTKLDNGKLKTQSKLTTVQTAFKDRIVKLKETTDMEEAEARFVAHMEEVQVKELKKAIYAPNLASIILSTVFELQREFPVRPDRMQGIDDESDDEEDDDNDLLEDASKRKSSSGSREKRKKQKVKRDSSISFKYMIRMLEHISKTWGHVYREPSHEEYAWRWEVFHGHNSEEAQWESHSKNPRKPNRLSFENFRFGKMPTMTGCDKLSDLIANFEMAVLVDAEKMALSAVETEPAPSPDNKKPAPVKAESIDEKKQKAVLRDKTNTESSIDSEMDPLEKTQSASKVAPKHEMGEEAKEPYIEGDTKLDTATPMVIESHDDAVNKKGEATEPDATISMDIEKKVETSLSDSENGERKADGTGPSSAEQTTFEKKDQVENSKRVLDVSQKQVDTYALAAHRLSPASSGVYDELLAFIKVGVLHASTDGIPYLAPDWASKVDVTVLDDMDAAWGTDMDADGRHCIHFELRDALEEQWSKSEYGWALADDPDDIIFDTEVLQEWRKTFEGKVEEQANLIEGIGRFGL